MTTQRDQRFRELMAENDAAYQEYRAVLGVNTTPLGGQPPTAREIDWDEWDRVKKRYDAAHEALLDFLRGGE